jgi:RNAse (barnase) inhibitor barstar
MDHHDPAERLTHRQGHGPYIHIHVTSPSDAFDLAIRLSATPGNVARVVRGAKSRTAPALFDEFAAAWQFPPYFGENWDALDECLSDLDWLPARAYFLVVTNAPQLLDRMPADAFQVFAELISKTAQAGPNSATFRTLLQVEPADEPALAARLKAAGAAFDML